MSRNLVFNLHFDRLTGSSFEAEKPFEAPQRRSAGASSSKLQSKKLDSKLPATLMKHDTQQEGMLEAKQGPVFVKNRARSTRSFS